VKRDTALEKELDNQTRHALPNAPSPLRSAGAVQKDNDPVTPERFRLVSNPTPPRHVNPCHLTAFLQV
jgi:hypothetical protein